MAKYNFDGLNWFMWFLWVAVVICCAIGTFVADNEYIIPCFVVGILNLIGVVYYRPRKNTVSMKEEK